MYRIRKFLLQHPIIEHLVHVGIVTSIVIAVDVLLAIIIVMIPLWTVLFFGVVCFILGIFTFIASVLRDKRQKNES